ncbi:unnamed protein product [Lactuca virosa]|uniref:Uncharacterized protein n=1 Tax=Lactuca virosa TaxID=75947 RepID=A0AAU9NGQ0_9ASTR|nr:unnamed protein product [Lactuca virosa]
MSGGDASEHTLETGQERSHANLESNAHRGSFPTLSPSGLIKGKLPNDKAVLVDNFSGAHTTTNILPKLITVQDGEQRALPPMSVIVPYQD